MNPSGQNYPVSCLYVGALHDDVTEDILFEKFSTVGPVFSIRICRDLITRRSLGYAYVNFQQPVDAERALDTINFDTVKGSPIRIMWSQQDPSLRKSCVGIVFIKNLDKSIDNRAMYDAFSAFGNILSCEIATDKKSGSKGYGFVHFETEEAANNAIMKVNGRLLYGRKVFVGKFIPCEDSEKLFGKKPFSKIYIKNFGYKLNNEKLRELFEKYGRITSAKVITDWFGKSKGFGFVRFEEPEDAVKAIEDLNGRKLNGRTLYVGYAQKKSEIAKLKQRFELLEMENIDKSQGVSVYVKNLHGGIDDEYLKKAFSPFGTITSAKVAMDMCGRSMGFGFVCFSSPEEASAAITGMNRKMLVFKHLYVGLALSKETREAYLAAQHTQQMAKMRKQLGQMSNPGSAEDFVPTVPQAQRNYFSQMAQMHATPRWPIQPQMQLGIAAMQSGPFARAAASPAITSLQNPGMTARMNARPVIDQQPTAAASGTRVAVMGPTGVGAARPTFENFDQRPASYKYTSSECNPSQPQTVQQTVLIKGQEPLTASILADVSVQEQKQMLGERLFPLIYRWCPEKARKITGMLLEIDNSELLHMLEHKQSLKSKVEEAVTILRTHHARGNKIFGRGIKETIYLPKAFKEEV